MRRQQGTRRRLPRRACAPRRLQEPPRKGPSPGAPRPADRAVHRAAAAGAAQRGAVDKRDGGCASEWEERLASGDWARRCCLSGCRRARGARGRAGGRGQEGGPHRRFQGTASDGCQEQVAPGVEHGGGAIGWSRSCEQGPRRWRDGVTRSACARGAAPHGGTATAWCFGWSRWICCSADCLITRPSCGWFARVGCIWCPHGPICTVHAPRHVGIERAVCGWPRRR